MVALLWFNKSINIVIVIFILTTQIFFIHNYNTEVRPWIEESLSCLAPLSSFQIKLINLFNIVPAVSTTENKDPFIQIDHPGGPSLLRQVRQDKPALAGEVVEESLSPEVEAVTSPGQQDAVPGGVAAEGAGVLVAATSRDCSQLSPVSREEGELPGLTGGRDPPGGDDRLAVSQDGAGALQSGHFPLQQDCPLAVDPLHAVAPPPAQDQHPLAVGNHRVAASVASGLETWLPSVVVDVQSETGF